MNKKGCVWLGLFGLVTLCLAVVALIYFQARARTFNLRPLLIIHSPVNHEIAEAGNAVFVHATARAEEGIARMELWMDDSLVGVREVTADVAPSMLVFTGDWIASSAGRHVLVVRAVSSSGMDGQASVVVEVQETTEGTHIVQEGETVESIASHYGIAPDGLAASNPDLEPGGPVAGDELTIPDDEAPDEEAAPPSDEAEEPPIPEGDPPGSMDSVFELPFLGPFRAYSFGAGDPTGLRIEIPVLATSVAEELHCYIGAAGFSPRWYPDVDNDQSTDESFNAVGGMASGTRWDTEGILTDDGSLVFMWPENLDLNLRVTCVGVGSGGTDSFELGTVELVAPPDEWDGMLRPGNGVASSGWMHFMYKVSHVGGRPEGVPLFLDPDMTPPTNARLDERRISLRWDYNPRDGEEPIDGFRIYLNGNLQWVEAADARESMLPYEWFNPPCGSTYAFNITAYRYAIPDGPESPPAIAMRESESVDCTREVLITFLTLETFDLGGDGSHEPRDGDVGPPYGYFYANDQRITFDGGALSAGGVDYANGFAHNTTYDLLALSARPDWHFNGMTAMVVDIPDGATFEFGYHIMDEDSGRCHDSSDPGCDDHICEGQSAIYYEDSPSDVFDRYNEGSITSENERCRVTYRWGPAGGSPVGSGAEGAEPLPWISIEDLEIDEESGQIRIHVRNSGTATWPWRDLHVELRTREGASLGVFTWEGFVLEAGQRTVLEDPDMRVSEPFDACVVIDPNDDVLEEYERSGALYHNPYCPALADLVITDVNYVSGQLLVTVQNIGAGTLENRSISIGTNSLDGTPLYIGGSYPNISLERFETVRLGFAGVSDFIREQMAAGYNVIVNPDGRIAESNTDNNTFTAPAATELMVAVFELHAPWDYRNTTEFTVTAHAVSGSARRQVGSLHFEDMDWGTCTRDTGCGLVLRASERENSTYWFSIYGDEFLEVDLRAYHRSGDWTINEMFLPSENWDANPRNSDHYCGDWNAGTPGWHFWTINTHEGNRLGATFQVCENSP